MCLIFLFDKVLLLTGDWGSIRSNGLIGQGNIGYKIAALKPASMGVRIDTPTPEQRQYLDSWSMGT